MPGQAEVARTREATKRIGPRGDRWADLRLRIVSAAVLVPLALGALWLGGLAWTVLIVASAAALAAEWAQLCRLLPSRRRWMALAAGVPYVGAAMLALLWLRLPEGGGRRAVLLLLVVVWASDIGAYLAGRALGGPRLAPAISPGKTWAGAAGGLLAAGLAGFLLPGALLPGASAGAALLLGLAAQAGDLLESAVKRGFGVKDSGRLIPGHGGLLDRVDGLLAAAPVAALLAILAAHGVVSAR